MRIGWGREAPCLRTDARCQLIPSAPSTAWKLSLYFVTPRRLIRKFSVLVLGMDDLGIFAALSAQKNLSIVLDTLAR
jgi:hypothetical protein